MNPLAILKASKFFIVGAILLLGLWMLRDHMKDQKEMRQQLQTAVATQISLEAREQELRNANVQLMSALEIIEESAASSRQAIEDLNRAFREARQVEADQNRPFEDHDLQSLANERTETIERLSNQATKARFDELAGVFNEN